MLKKQTFIAYVRTFTPAVAGSILLTLTGFGIEVESDAVQNVIEPLVVGAATLVWYAAVRGLAFVSKLPFVEALNGWATSPDYLVPPSER